MASRSLFDTAMVPAAPVHVAAPVDAGLGRVVLALISLPLWLAMAVVAALMLVVMLVLEPVLRADEAIRGGAPRKRFRIGALF